MWVRELVIIGSSIGMAQNKPEIITRAYGNILLIGPFRTNLN